MIKISDIVDIKGVLYEVVYMTEDGSDIELSIVGEPNEEKE